MSIIIDEDTRLLVQGITGSEGSFHTRRCMAYGTKVVAGVTPGKGGTSFDGVPVFNEVERAVKETGANASMIFVPPAFAADAILEAADAGITPGGMHYRRHPYPGHGYRSWLSEGEIYTSHRAQLPRGYLTGEVKGRAHAR